MREEDDLDSARGIFGWMIVVASLIVAFTYIWL